MKKFTKTLISLLLIVSLFAGYVPSFIQTQTASAASEPTYRYKKVSTLTPGKTYLIVGAADCSSTLNAGAVWALAPSRLGSTLSEGGNVGTAVVYTPDANYIYPSYGQTAGFQSPYWSNATSLEDLEWTYLPGNAATEGGLPATYMFQNTSTGAWLYNPVYDDGDGSSMEVTLDPLSDTYSPYTRQVFNSQAAINAYKKSTSGTATITNETSWAKILTSKYSSTDSSCNDNTVTLSLGNQTGFYDFVSIFYSANTSGGTLEQFVFYDSTWYENNYGSTFGTQWNGFILSDNFSDGLGLTGKKAVSYRFDVEKTGGNIYLSSAFLAKNIHARVALYYYRFNHARYGANGYYPSQRYPFSQYVPVSVGNGAFRIGNFASDSNIYTQQYYYGWSSDTTMSAAFTRSWNNTANLANTFFFEKEEVTSADTVWERVTSSSDIVNGGEYLIVNSAETTSSARTLSGGSSGGLSISSGKSIQGNYYTSDVADNDIWKFVKVGDYYYLMNSAGEYLIATADGSYNLGTMSQADVGDRKGDSKIIYGTRYRFQYNLSTNQLEASHTNQNLNESLLTTKFGMASNGSISGSSTIYLYKKVYHTHSWNSGTVTTAATCTSTGVMTYTCTSCGITKTETISALGHNYVSAKTNATCTEKGYTTYTCSRCDSSYIADYVNATGHTWGDWVENPKATCTTAGLKTRTCTVCSATETEEVAQLGHDYVTTETGATCTESGYTTYVCSRGDSTYTDNSTAPLGHNWDEGVVITPATKESDGVIEYTCTRCQETKTDIIPMIKETSVTVSSAETEAGGTVTLSVTLENNPGLWAQSFVVYYPINLELVSITPASDVYGNGNVSYKQDNPTTNTTMSKYFAAADITANGLYGAAYCVHNSEDANTTANGTIVQLTFKVPSGTVCQSTYEIGIFGVYSNTGDDAINYNADSVDIVYYNGKITVTDVTDCEHETTEWKTITAATCETAGYKELVCTICGTVIDNAVIPATGHSYTSKVTSPDCYNQGYTTHTCTNGCGNDYVDSYTDTLEHSFNNGVVIKHETGLSGIIVRYTCSRCEYWYDSEEKSATSDDTSRGDEAKYIYRLTSTVTAGNEYIIASSNKTGSAYAMTDSSLGVGTTVTPVTVKSDSKGKYIEAPDSTDVLWTTASGILFNNRYTGGYLSAFNSGNARNTHLNITTAQNPFDDLSAYTFTNGTNTAGYSLGFEDSLGTATVTAAPSGSYMKPESFTAITTAMTQNGDIQWNGTETVKMLTSDNFRMEFDMSFLNADTTVSIYRLQSGIDYGGETADHFEFSPSSVVIVSNGETTTESYTYGSDTYDYKHWNHYSIVVENGTATIYVNGAETVSADWSNTEEYQTFLFVYPDVSWNGESLDTRRVGVDNIHIFSSISPIEDCCYNFELSDDKTKGFQDLSVSDIATVSSSYTVGIGDTIAQNVFTASESSSNKVYFYEKTLVNNVPEIYKLASTVDSGKAYVLVSENGTAEAASVSGSDNTTTVYMDGISYVPYVTVDDSNEYTITKTDGGVLISNSNGYLLSDGTVAEALSEKCIISEASAIVEIGGTKYYLYEKDTVTEVDAGLVTGVAVVDFGSGFTLDADSYFRSDAASAQRVGMTFSTIASSLTEGTETNSYFYTDSHIVGDGTTAELDGGTAVANADDSTISFTPTNAFTGEQTFNYGYTIDNIGAYIYGEVLIIPATTIYYEDNASFITYTDGKDNNAKWSLVGEHSLASQLLTSTYGNSEAYEGASEAYFSAGGAHKAIIYADDVLNGVWPATWAPTASFTFTGTGFEVFSATGQTTCLIFVSVTDSAGNVIYNVFMDNYYGYTYDETAEEHWQPVSDQSAEPALYQVPVISRQDLAYDTYTVTITCSYDKRMDPQGFGYSEFYLDGVRIFNPLGDTASETATAKYMEDNEYAPVFINLRDVVTSDKMVGDNYALYVDGYQIALDSDEAFQKYAEVGAKNEVSIPSGKAIAFKLKASGASPAKVSLGAKLTNGASATLTIGYNDTLTNLELKSTTDMFYDISSILTWRQEDGYWVTDTIVITNTSSDTISLTKAKFSYGSTVEAASVELYSDDSTASDAAKTLASIYAEDVSFTVGDVNGDNRLNGKDMLALRRTLAGSVTGLTYAQRKASDTNGDGRISSLDVSAMKRIVSRSN